MVPKDNVKVSVEVLLAHERAARHPRVRGRQFRVPYLLRSMALLRRPPEEQEALVKVAASSVWRQTALWIAMGMLAFAALGVWNLMALHTSTLASAHLIALFFAASGFICIRAVFVRRALGSLLQCLAGRSPADAQ